MRYLALCSDYDGTLATEGEVFPATVIALQRLIASGRRVVLVTGRELDELKTVCPCLPLFEYVVAENGALLYQPATGTETALAERPPDAFVAALLARGVGPISVGRVIVATWEPHEAAVLETIQEQGLELQVIFNKGAVMILPAGVNKASGLAAALLRMGLSPHNAVGIGDAENDHALLALCECGVAVANALPTLKEAADLVTASARGAGVAELIEALLTDDLASLQPALARHEVLLGFDGAGREVRLQPYGENVLLAASQGSDSAPSAALLLSGLSAAKYRFCAVDIAGEFESVPGAVSLGTPDRPPSIDEILQLLRGPDESCVINLAGLPAAARPTFFGTLLPRIEQLRAHTGRPHWLLLIAPSPQLLPDTALAGVSLLIATGHSAQQALVEFARVTGRSVPSHESSRLQPGEGLVWQPLATDAAPFRLSVKPA